MRGAFILLCTCAWATAAVALPDLVVDQATLSTGVGVELQVFKPDACELQAADLCVGGPGGRKVLRFSVLAVNQGDQDLVVGNPLDDPNATLPNGAPEWVYSTCHHHYHFQTFARYELRPRGETTPILTGQKRSFCVEDTRRVTSSAAGKYCCNPGPTCPVTLQGVQVGWGDLYPSNLPCQWIDITDGPTPGTDVASGDYDLCVILNTAGYLDEQPQDNDTTCIPVTIDAPAHPAPHVKVLQPRAKKPVHPGAVAKIAWKRKLRGKLTLQEVWWSKDDGATWSLIDTVTTRAAAYRWTVPADAATDTARVRVTVWQRYPKDGTTAGAYQRGIAESATFHIAP